VYRNTALLVVVDGRVKRECYGLEWEDNDRPFTGWDPPGYGEPWATVNEKSVPVAEAAALALSHNAPAHPRAVASRGEAGCLASGGEA